jgi:hypothetical protein
MIDGAPMADDAKLEQDIEAALRTGDPDNAARVLMAAKNISLDEARKQIFERLKQRKK